MLSRIRKIIRNRALKGIVLEYRFVGMLSVLDDNLFFEFLSRLLLLLSPLNYGKQMLSQFLIKAHALQNVLGAVEKRPSRGQVTFFLRLLFFPFDNIRCPYVLRLYLGLSWFYKGFNLILY
jgi:hypothetical protein